MLTNAVSDDTATTADQEIPATSPTANSEIDMQHELVPTPTPAATTAAGRVASPLLHVTPAKAGVHASGDAVAEQWIPAFAGMTRERLHFIGHARSGHPALAGRNRSVEGPARATKVIG
jgi:hypothetical protein